MKIKNLTYNTEKEEDAILSVLRTQLEAYLAELKKDFLRYKKENYDDEIIKDTLARIVDLENTIAGTYDFEGWLIRAYPTELSDLKVFYSKDGDYTEEETSRMIDSIYDKQRRHRAYRAKANFYLASMFAGSMFFIDTLEETIKRLGKEQVLGIINDIDINSTELEHIPMEHNYTLAELREEPLKYMKYKL